MSKKILAILVLGCAIFSFCAGQGYAGPVVTAKTEAAIARARDTLKAQEWVIYLTPEGGKAVGETDVITFTEEGEVSSKNLLAKGYGDSNFRLTVEANGMGVWETMKVDKDKNLAFLRGELIGSEMRGSIFMKSTRGTTETYYYSTSTAPTAPVISEVSETKTTTTKRGRR